MECFGLASVTYVQLFFDKKSFWGGVSFRASVDSMYVYGRRRRVIWDLGFGILDFGLNGKRRKPDGQTNGQTPPLPLPFNPKSQIQNPKSQIQSRF